MNERKTTEQHLETRDQIIESSDQTRAESSRIPFSKEKEPSQQYPSDTPGTAISEPPSKEYSKEEEIKTDLYGLSKPKRNIVRAKIFYD